MSTRGGFVGWAMHEVKRTALATVYFLVGFNLLALLLALLTPGFRNPAALFSAATFAALVVGKVIVVSDGLFRRLVPSTGSFLRNVLLKSATFTLVVLAVLAAEDVVHGIMSEDLSWTEAWAHLLEASRGGRRFVARFAYLFVLFVAYCFLFEIDRYFVGTSIADIILSRYRTVRTQEATVMRVGLVNPIPASEPLRRAELVRELYDTFARLAASHGGRLEAYRGRAGVVFFPEATSASICHELLDEMSAYLEDNATRHAAIFEQDLVLRAGVASGPIQTLEVTSGDRREIIRAGRALDDAEVLFESAAPREIAFARGARD